MIGMLVNMFLVRFGSLVGLVGLGGSVSLIRGFGLSSSLRTILALFCVVSGGVGMIFAVLFGFIVVMTIATVLARLMSK